MKLPEPSSKYIDGADGYWYSEKTGTRYMANALPSNVADTYRPVKSVYPTSGVLYEKMNFKNLLSKKAINFTILPGKKADECFRRKTEEEFHEKV